MHTNVTDQTTFTRRGSAADYRSFHATARKWSITVAHVACMAVACRLIFISVTVDFFASDDRNYREHGFEAPLKEPRALTQSSSPIAEEERGDLRSETPDDDSANLNHEKPLSLPRSHLRGRESSPDQPYECKNGTAVADCSLRPKLDRSTFSDTCTEKTSAMVLIGTFGIFVPT
mmetsp:Transcript_4948/g.14366  ORF Transcript_4948/g.14366 Transcript_4948/m.14366 type:complete len:175 (-) Transcript_4948:224-748(-)